MAEGFQWEEAHARLEWARRALEGLGERSSEEVARILRERAQALARPPAAIETPGDVLDLLVFTVAGERYGIETAHVLEVIALLGLTPLPGVPPVFLGVVNSRGRILPVVDLRRLFGLAGQGVGEGGRAVLVDAAEVAFGIYADAVGGIVQVSLPDLAPAPSALGPGRQRLIRGITGEMVAVVDVEAMARDPRIVVNEEVG